MSHSRFFLRAFVKPLGVVTHFFSLELGLASVDERHPQQASAANFLNIVFMKSFQFVFAAVK